MRLMPGGPVRSALAHVQGRGKPRGVCERPARGEPTLANRAWKSSAEGATETRSAHLLLRRVVWP